MRELDVQGFPTSEIWLAARQHCCRDAWHIFKQYEHSNTQVWYFLRSYDQMSYQRYKPIPAYPTQVKYAAPSPIICCFHSPQEVLSHLEEQKQGIKVTGVISTVTDHCKLLDTALLKCLASWEENQRHLGQKWPKLTGRLSGMVSSNRTLQEYYANGSLGTLLWLDTKQFYPYPSGLLRRYWGKYSAVLL